MDKRRPPPLIPPVPLLPPILPVPPVPLPRTKSQDSLTPDDAFRRQNGAPNFDPGIKARRPTFDDFLTQDGPTWTYPRLSAVKSTSLRNSSSATSQDSLKSSRSSLPKGLLPHSPSSSVARSQENSIQPTSSTSIWGTGKTTPWLRRRSASSAELAKRQALKETKARTGFGGIPVDVFEHVLGHLRAVHENASLASCPSCLTRDLYSLCLVSRTWDRETRRHLYWHVSIAHDDASSIRKRYKIKAYGQIVLLRRTLRSRQDLAKLVFTLHIPLYLSPSPLTRETADQVASLVMSCPNLERLTPIHSYEHSFSRLDYALSTRPRLRSHAWLIAPSEPVTARSHTMLPPGLMGTHQITTFLSLHRDWRSLTNLALHALPGGILEAHIFPSMFALLPALIHLSLSSFDVDDFHGSNLLCLPPLQSLRLENLPSISGPALLRWASTSQAKTTRSLSLFDMGIATMGALGGILPRLPVLQDLVFVQRTPIVQDEELVFHPLLSSSSLQRLVWDCRPWIPAAGSWVESTASPVLGRGEPGSQGGATRGHRRKSSSIHISRASFSPPSSPPTSPSVSSPPFTPRTPQYSPLSPLLSSSSSYADDPTHLLALSIQHGGFPSLRRLTTPSDPLGALQAVCTPRFRFSLPGDRFHSATRLPRVEYVQTLHAARQGAEKRAGEARERGEGVCVQVQERKDEVDDDGFFNRELGASLKGPDVIGRGGWVGIWPGARGGVEYVIGERERAGSSLGLEREEGKLKSFCYGAWNQEHPLGRKWWHHEETERRWPKDLDLWE